MFSYSINTQLFRNKPERGDAMREEGREGNPSNRRKIFETSNGKTYDVPLNRDISILLWGRVKGGGGPK